jgi:hypothetical protein
VCGPRKTWRLCQDIEAAKPNRFITLTTAGHEKRTPREVWNQARRQVSELAKWVRRTKGEMEYCRVLEQHKSGYPHFHLLVRSPYIAQSELSRHWCKLTDAFIVDISKVDPSRSVASYVAKYLTKQMSVGFTERRVSQSKHFFVKKPTKPESELQMEGIERHEGNAESFLATHWSSLKVEQLGQSHWCTEQVVEVWSSEDNEPPNTTTEMTPQAGKTAPIEKQHHFSTQNEEDYAWQNERVPQKRTRTTKKTRSSIVRAAAIAQMETTQEKSSSPTG